MEEGKSNRTLIIVAAAVFPVVFAGLLFFAGLDRSGIISRAEAAQKRADDAWIIAMQARQDVAVSGTQVQTELISIKASLSRIERRLDGDKP